MQTRVRQVYLFRHGSNLRKEKKNSPLGMVKKTRVETHMQRETQTDKNCLKQTGRRVFLYISICEGGV